MFSNTIRSVGQSSFRNSVFARYSSCTRVSVYCCCLPSCSKKQAHSAGTILVRKVHKSAVLPFGVGSKYASSLVCRRDRMMSGTPGNPVQKFSSGEISGNAAMGSSDATADKPSQAAMNIFMEAVESVKPATLLKSKMTLSADLVLEIEDCDKKTALNLKEYENIFVVGFGKAALPMAEEVMSLMGNERVKNCFVNIPEGFRDTTNPAIEINRGAAKNIPDDAAFLGAQRIVDIAKSCGANDLLIVLITGGGSALLPYPIPPMTIQDKSRLVKQLSLKGATIQELNSVRKRLSLVKGGGLAHLSGCKRIVSLVLSDVLGDPLDVIASGPTVPNPDPQDLALQIIQKYVSPSEIPESALKVLRNNAPKILLKEKAVSNLLIGNNSVALEKACETAKSLGLIPFIITNKLSGEASEIGIELANLAMGVSIAIHKKTDKKHWAFKVIEKAADRLMIEEDILSKILSTIEDQNSLKEAQGVCFLFGGETTVTVKGSGVGGRNQELVLKAATQLDGSIKNESVLGKVAILSGGTDGFDGPCDAAGAFCNATTVQNGLKSKLSPFDFLIANDSYNYFSKNSNGGYHIKTGHTETNVMDIIVVVVANK